MLLLKGRALKLRQLVYEFKISNFFVFRIATRKLCLGHIVVDVNRLGPLYELGLNLFGQIIKVVEFAKSHDLLVISEAVTRANHQPGLLQKCIDLFLNFFG